MRFHRPLSMLSLLAALALPGLAAAQHLDNPFSGTVKWYVNPDYTANANMMAAQETDSTLAARMRLVGQQNTAVWMDRIAAVPSLATHLDNALDQGANLFLGVVYDLPGRDCHALASNGELPNSLAGLTRYKSEYIDPIVATVSQSKYAGIRIVFVVEPDSLPNLVTNMSDPDCAAAAAAQSGAPDGIYIEGIRYAVNKLHAVSNVYLYIDSGHSGWLGWPNNFDGWVTMMGKVASGFTAGKNAIEGFVDDTANTLPTKEPFLSPGMTIGGQDIKSSKFLDWNPYPDEQSFSAALYQGYVSAGWPSTLGILHDTSRNGWGGPSRTTVASTSTDVNTYVNASKVDRRAHRGLWCNPLGAGIGEMPQGAPTNWPNSHFDAYVWVKPPGESDGASKEIANDQGKGFDRMCDPTYMTDYGVLTGATPDAPLSGDFFPAQFKTLVQNIFPVPGSGPVCQSLPAAPSNLSAKQVSGGQIDLSWTGGTAPTNCSVTYTVHRGTTYNFTPSSSTQVKTGLTSTSYSVTGLTPNTTYYFLVQAVDALGSTSSSYIQQNTPNGYILSVAKTGTGATSATVSGGGIDCGSTCSVVTNPSVTVTLTAVPASGGSFTGWSGDCSGSSATCVVNMSMNRSVSAAFSGSGGTTYALSVTKSGTGGGTVSGSGLTCGTSSCSGSYSSGTAVTLTATPDSSSTFSGWSGACTGTGSCIVTMTAAQSVTATFAATSVQTYTLSVSKAGTGTGSVISSSGGISCGSSCSATYTSGTVVTLTASATSPSTFAGFSGCSGSGNTCVVTVSANTSVVASFNGGSTGTTPVAKWGRLKVCGTHICDASGNQVQLKGMSLFWSNTWWGGERFFNADAVQNLYSTWGATVIRAPLGVEGGGSYVVSNDSKNPIDPTGNLSRITTVIDAAIATGIYVIVDWHYSSATVYQSQAQAFFQQLATKYASSPNIIWEPYNEPTTNSWSSLKSYHEAIIQTIRAAGSQNLVVVGTPTWSQDVDTASQSKVVDSASNTAYTLHFYAGTHGSWLRDKANTAMSNGAALFVTEWGTVDASGDGGYNASESTNWTNWMDQNKISSCNWSLNDKAESASALISGGSASATGPWSDSQLTQSGQYVKAYIAASVQPTTYTLTVSKAGTGSGTVTASSINCGSTCSATYNAGTVVTLTAAAASGSTFAGWSVSGCSGTTCAVTMSATQSVTATFNVPTQSYTLTVAKAGTGSGTVTSSVGGISCGSTCAATFSSATTVTLTASAASGSTFAGWSYGSCGTSTTCAVSVSASQTVTATFNVPTQNYTLSVAKAGTGSGTVTSSAGGISCGSTCAATFSSATTVTLTATAASGSTFGGWSVSGCSGTTCVISVSGSQTVTATFNGPTQTGGCQVTYSVTNSWPGGFQGALSIKNTSTTAWSNWTLTFTFANGQSITQMWNAAATQSGGTVTAKSLSYNGSIPAGGSYTSVGFTGSWNGTNSAPTGFAVNGVTCN